MFTELRLSTISVKAVLLNYDFKSEEIAWEAPLEGPIKRITSGIYDSMQPGFKPQVKIKNSKRGRKPKVRKRSNKINFGSNVIFTICKETSRAKKIANDKYTNLAEIDPQNNSNELIQKEYKLKLFNKGSIICVGIVKEDKSDFMEIANYVVEYINNKGVDPPVALSKVESTMQNYQFNITGGRLISLIKFQEQFTTSYLPRLISISTGKMNDFIYKMYGKELLIDSEKLFKYISGNSSKDTIYLDKELFAKFFQGYSLKNSFAEIDKICNNLYNSFDRIVDEEFRQYTAKLYIESKVIPDILFKLEKKGIKSPANIRYNKKQAALIISYGVGNKKISAKLFGSGSIGIHGCKSSKEAKKIMLNIYHLIKVFEEEVLYYEDCPPIYEDIETCILDSN